MYPPFPRPYVLFRFLNTPLALTPWDSNYDIQQQLFGYLGLSDRCVFRPLNLPPTD